MNTFRTSQKNLFLGKYGRASATCSAISQGSKWRVEMLRIGSEDAVNEVFDVYHGVSTKLYVCNNVEDQQMKYREGTTQIPDWGFQQQVATAQRRTASRARRYFQKGEL